MSINLKTYYNVNQNISTGLAVYGFLAGRGCCSFFGGGSTLAASVLAVSFSFVAAWILSKVSLALLAG